MEDWAVSSGRANAKAPARAGSPRERGDSRGVSRRVVNYLLAFLFAFGRLGSGGGVFTSLRRVTVTCFAG